jgi:hypothetical protein
MPNTNGATAEEAGLYPGGGNINIPKRGGLWKYIAIGSAAAIAGIAGYQILNNDYKTPDNSQKHAIVDTENVPEGFGEKPEIVGEGALDSLRLARGNESVAAEPKKPGMKPYLGGLAWTDNEGWIYPDSVNQDQKGRLKYDTGRVEDVVLLCTEAYNNKYIDIYLEFSWRVSNGRKEDIFTRVKKNFEKDYKILERYKIIDIHYKGDKRDKADVYILTDDWETPRISNMKLIKGQWVFV